MGIDYKKKYLKYKNKYLEAQKLYGGGPTHAAAIGAAGFRAKNMRDFESKFESFKTNVEELKREGKFDAAAAKGLKNEWNKVEKARGKPGVHLKTLGGPHPAKEEYEKIKKVMNRVLKSYAK